MPDVWTNNPPKLMRMLRESGWTCPGEARIVKDRDPEMTCNITQPEWYGDIYVHDAVQLIDHPFTIGAGGLMFIVGALFGYVAAKRAAPAREREMRHR